MLRYEKTNKDRDDLRVLSAGIVCTLLILTSSLLIPRFQEYRWYRDLMALTPFHSVEVHSQEFYNMGILITGVLIKRRCTFNDLIAYVKDKEGISHLVYMNEHFRNEEEEDINKNRPPSDDLQKWGPWYIAGQAFDPVGYSVYAEHIECPTEPTTQRNLFVSGDWEEFSK